PRAGFPPPIRPQGSPREAFSGQGSYPRAILPQFSPLEPGPGAGLWPGGSGPSATTNPAGKMRGVAAARERAIFHGWFFLDDLQCGLARVRRADPLTTRPQLEGSKIVNYFGSERRSCRLACRV